MEYKRLEITIQTKNLSQTIWTQIYDHEGEIISSFISDSEIEALEKAIKFLTK